MLARRVKQSLWQQTRGKRGVAWLSVGLLLVAGFFYVRSLSNQTIRLPNDGEAEIVGVTSGDKQQFVYGAPWEKLAYYFLPKRFMEEEEGRDERLSYWRFKEFEGCRVELRPADRSVVLWVRHSGLAEPRDLQVVTLGPEGRPFGTAMIHRLDSLGGRSIDAWELDSFPRREALLRCQLLRRQGTDWEEVGRFSVRNPEQQDFPEWSPEPFPITRRNHGLTVKLTDVKTGSHSSYGAYSEPPTPYCTRLGMVVERDGEPTAPWRPTAYEWVDATGNQSRGDWNGVVVDDVNFEHGRIFPGLMGPSEPWKIRIGFRAKPGARLPEDRLIHVRDFRWSMDDSSVVEKEIAGVSLEVRTDGNRYSEEVPLLRVQRTPVEEGHHLTVIEAKDESGRELVLTRNVFNTEKGITWFEVDERELEMPQELDLTLALYKTRWFEFVAQPSVFSDPWTSPTTEDVPELIDGLQSPDRTTRWNAAEALIKLGPRAEEAVPALAAALGDSSPKVRKASTRALGKVGGAAAEASDALIGLLDDPDPFIAGRAAWALGEIGASAEKVVPILTKALASDNVHLRRYAARALGKYGPLARSAVPKLLGLLDDSHPWVRQAAVVGLGRAQAEPERVLPKLVPLVRADEDQMRRNAREAIIRLGSPPKASLDRLTGIAKGAADFEIRQGAIETLGRLGTDAEPVLPDLEDIARTAEPMTALTAAAALIRIEPSNQVGREVFHELLDHPDAGVREKAAEELGQLDIKEGRLYSALLEAVEDPEADVRRGAVRSIGTIGISDPEAVGKLIDALSDEDERVRNSAVRELATTGAPEQLAEEALPQLEAMLSEAGNRERYAAALAIWRLNPNPESFGRAAEILQNRTGKGPMLYMLRQIGPPAQPFAPVLEELWNQTAEQRQRERITETLASLASEEG